MLDKRDSVVEEVREDLLRRSRVGIKKYGVTLEREDLELSDWLQHAYEECLDQANYLKKAILITKNKQFMSDKTTVNPVELATDLAHNDVITTVDYHNSKFPNNSKEIYEEIEEITPEYSGTEYSEFAQAIFNERYDYYYNQIQKKR